MYSKIKRPITVAVMLTVIALSCKKALEFPNRLYISQAKESSLMQLTLDDGRGSVNLTAATAYEVDDPLEVAFSVLDSDFVNDYNTMNGTEFEIVPNSATTLSASNVSIPSGQAFSNSITVTVEDWTGYDNSKQYVVPVRISGSNRAQAVVEGSDFLLISINKIIHSTGTRFRTGEFGGYTADKNMFVPVAESTTVYDDLTVEGRFNYQDNFTGGTRWFCTIFTGANNLWLTMQEGNLVFGASTDRVVLSPLSTNVWYHFAIVKKGTTLTIYLNGNPVGSKTWTLALIDFKDGAMFGNFAGTTGFVASEYRVWRTARSQKQLQTSMCAANPSDPNLIGYWPLDADHPTEDISGNGYDLSLTAGTIITHVDTKCPNE